MRCLPLSLVAALVLVFSCKEAAPQPEDLAAQAAVTYYEHLLAGRYDEYLAGVAGTDSIPADYREQLTVNARQFVAQQQREHKGISSVQVVRAKTDSLAGQTHVFLMLCFGDSVKEEIVVPMVEHAGRWLMR